MIAATRMRGHRPAPSGYGAIAGLVRYYDMSLETPLADGTGMAAWVDFSTLVSNATQSSGTQRPAFRTNVQNGLPVARFDGTNDYVNLSSLAALTGGHLFAVLKTGQADPPPGQPGTGLWDMGASSVTHFPFTDGVIYDGTGTTVRKTTANPAATLAAFNVYEVETASGSWTSRLNGTQIHTTASNTVSFPAAPKIGVANGGTIFFNGDIGAWLLYSAPLSGGDATTVRNALKAQWGTP